MTHDQLLALFERSSAATGLPTPHPTPEPTTTSDPGDSGETQKSTAEQVSTISEAARTSGMFFSY